MVNASVIKSHSAPRLIPCTAEGDSAVTASYVRSHDFQRDQHHLRAPFRRPRDGDGAVLALLPGLIAAVAPGDHARARNIADHVEALGSVPNNSVSYREGVT